jgi:hypothetical protein
LVRSSPASPRHWAAGYETNIRNQGNATLDAFVGIG